MALEIKSNKIGADLYAQNEKFFNGVLIATASTFTSSAVRFHQTLGGVEAKIIAASDFTLLDTKTITVNVTVSDAEGGTFVQEAQIGLITASGNTAISKGDVLGSYIRPSEIASTYYAKFSIVTSGAQTGAAADGYIVQV